MQTQHDIVDLLGWLYDAAANADNWPAFMARLSASFDSSFAILTVIDCRTREIRFATFHNLDAIQLQQVRPILEQKDPLYRTFVRKMNMPICCRFEIDEDSYRESEFYRAVMRPFGLEYRLAVAVDVAPAKATSLAVMRGPEGPPYTEEDCRDFSELIPHFRRAARIHYRLSQAEAAETALTDILDHMPLGVVITDSALRVSFANRAAETISRRGRGLRLRNGELFAERAADSRLMRSHVVELADEARWGLLPPGRALAIERDCGRPLQLMISPLPRGAVKGLPEAARRAMFAVFATDPNVRQETTPELLRRMFGLTPAESAVLQELLAGGTLADAAEARGIVAQTARNQLKSVFRKMGVKRQADAVAKVVTSPAWQRHQAASELLREAVP